MGRMTGSNSYLRRIILLGVGPDEEDALELGGDHGEEGSGQTWNTSERWGHQDRFIACGGMAG